VPTVRNLRSFSLYDEIIQENEGWSKINRTVAESWTIFKLSLIVIYHN
jgi:hypothetical protein